MNLAEKVKQYMLDSGKGIATVAKEIKIGRSTLSKYLSGTYTSNPANVETAITVFFENKDTQTLDAVAATKETKTFVDGAFFKSMDAQNVMAVAKACQDEKSLGCIIGTSGYGKTLTLKKYATLDKVIYIECNSLMTRRDLLTRIEKGIGLPVGRGTSDDRTNTIVGFFNKNKGYLVIVDEADKLITRDTIEKLEILRTIYDLCVEEYDNEMHTVGILIAGEPRLKTNILSWNDRYARRIDQYYELKGLKRNEVISYLEGLDMTQKAVEELVYRATNERSGCFRLLNRTLKNIKRVLGDRTKITGEIIIEASSMMML